MRRIHFVLIYVLIRIYDYAEWMMAMAVLPPLKQEIHQLHSRLCAGLADPKRILLLYALADGPRNVSNLTETLALPQPTISRHLKLLRERGLVLAERDGQSVFYSLTDRRVIQALDLLRTVLADMLENQANLARSITQNTPSDISQQEKLA
jgi:DNA-binding transcriptional ArsR family regulator